MFILPVSDDIGMVYSWVYHIHTVNIVNVRGYICIYSHKNVKKVAHPHGTSIPILWWSWGCAFSLYVYNSNICNNLYI